MNKHKKAVVALGEMLLNKIQDSELERVKQKIIEMKKEKPK